MAACVNCSRGPCAVSDIYPQNLPYQTRTKAALESCTKYLKENSDQLFQSVDDGAEVGVIDCQAGSNANLKIIHDESGLDTALMPSISRPNSASMGHRSPNCRFICIHSMHSEAQLKVTHRMANRILTHHRISPDYIDFVSAFGRQSGGFGIKTDGFRSEKFLNKSGLFHSPTDTLVKAIPRHYQICFTLKTIACTNPAEEELMNLEWRARQGAFHHQFDVDNGDSLWLVTSGRTELREKIVDFINNGDNARPQNATSLADAFRSALSTHLCFIEWASANWKHYVKWMEQVFEYKYQDVLYSSREARPSRTDYKVESLQGIQRDNDKLNDIIFILKGNLGTLKNLRDFYYSLREKEVDTLKICLESFESFDSILNRHLSDLGAQLVRAELLAVKMVERRELIQQLIQSQDTEKTASVSLNARDIALQSQQEAIAMRIVTVVTLVFLPATFVSTFFSTSVVSYPDGTGSEVLSTPALFRWLQLVLPLTFVTLALGWLFYKKAYRQRIRLDVPIVGLNFKNDNRDLEKGYA